MKKHSFIDWDCGYNSVDSWFFSHKIYHDSRAVSGVFPELDFHNSRVISDIFLELRWFGLDLHNSRTVSSVFLKLSQFEFDLFMNIPWICGEIFEISISLWNFRDNNLINWKVHFIRKYLHWKNQGQNCVTALTILIN